MPEFWGQKAFCVITGASRGFGKAMAIAFCQHVGADSTFLLTARSLEGLRNTRNQMLLSCPKNSNLKVHLLEMDLTRPNEEEFRQALEEASYPGGLSSPKGHYDHAIIVHNAGIMGSLNTPTLQYSNSNLQLFFDFLSIELASAFLFNSPFFSRFADAEQKSIISITFDAGFKPYKTLGMICAGKAAKDMLMRTIALEEAGRVEVILFDPEPIDTDMFEETLRGTLDPEQALALAQMRTSGALLSPETAAHNLVEVLRERRYRSGEYYVCNTCNAYNVLDQ